MLAGYGFPDGGGGRSGRDGGGGGSIVDRVGGVENMEGRRCLHTPDKEGE